MQVRLHLRLIRVLVVLVGHHRPADRLGRGNPPLVALPAVWVQVHDRA
jgi:hypothetical protein